MIAVLNWCLEHWFLIFILSALGVFEAVRDFLLSCLEAVAGIGERRHQRKLEQIRMTSWPDYARPAAMPPKPGPCVHRQVTPVVSAEVVVAWLCRCGAQLPADWAVRQEDL
jgi:hypothetical protein